MATVKSNRIFLNKSEVEELNKKLDLVKTPDDWINIVREIFNSVDMDFTINWNPVLKEFKAYNNIDLSWVGNISGNIIDLKPSKKRCEIYGFSICSESNSRFGEYLLRYDNGSGGGGRDFRYDSFRLKVQDFPEMAKIYTLEMTSAKVNSEILKSQKVIDDYFKDLDSQLSELISTKVKASVELNTIDTRISQLMDALAAANSLRKSVENKVHDQAKEEFSKNNTIEYPNNPMLNLSRSRAFRNRLVNSGGVDLSKTKLSQIDLRIQKLLDENAEIFV